MRRLEYLLASQLTPLLARRFVGRRPLAGSGAECCDAIVKFHFKYEADLDVTGERALTALVPDPLTRPERPMLASWHIISKALEMRLNEVISEAPGLQLLGGGFALTPLETGDAE